MGILRTFTIAKFTSAISLALDEAGRPFVAFMGRNPVTSQDGLVLAAFDGTAWSHELVKAQFGASLDLEISNGSPIMAWQDVSNSDLVVSSRDGVGGWTHEVAEFEWKDEQQALDLAVDRDGALQIAYNSYDEDSYMSIVTHLARDSGGAWRRDVVLQDHPYPVFPQVRTGPNGELAIRISGQTGSFIALRDAGQWFVQRVSGVADIAFDAEGVLTAARISFPNGAKLEVSYMTLTGVYPAGYRESCERVAQVACAAVCSCGPDCCVQDETCYGTSRCEYSVRGQVCGDASQDPNLVYACEASVGMTRCAQRGAVIPAACMLL